jgi:hypothetical protein
MSRLAIVAVVLLVSGSSCCSSDDQTCHGRPDPFCVAGSSRSCVCGDGSTGSATCSASGDAFGACTCQSEPISFAASGLVYTSISSFALDGVPVSATFSTPAPEANASEACLGHAWISAGFSSPSGCSLDLEYGAGDASFGGLRSIVVTVGPDCEGFTTEQQGIYVSPPGWGIGDWWRGPTTWPAGSTSVNASISFPDRILRLERQDGAALLVNLRDVTLSGEMVAKPESSPFLGCLSAGCALGYHDGGSGWCTPAGSCIAGYHDGGQGNCVPVGQCSPGIGLSRGGACDAVWSGPIDGPGTGRTNPFLFQLPSGKVLLVGGYTVGSNPHDPQTAELYDPLDGVWKPTGAPLYKHEDGAFVGLADGSVLATGGFLGEGGTAVAERYDPVAGTWTAVRPMGTPRFFHTATLLKDGRVLVLGGQTSVGLGEELDSAEVYDPVLDFWTPTPFPPLAGRSQHAAVRLGDGRVLVVGGFGGADTAELWDPSGGVFTASQLPGMDFAYPRLAVLDNGRVLAWADLYTWIYAFDPGSGAWDYVQSMHGNDFWATVTPLRHGLALVEGRAAVGVVDVSSKEWFDLPKPNPLREGHAALRLSDGSVFLVSGADDASAAVGAGRTSIFYIGGR